MNNNPTPVSPPPRPTPTHCLNPECHKDFAALKQKPARGLCQSCYAVAHRMILMGNASWEELERLGLAAALRKRGPVKKGTSMERAIIRARQAHSFPVTQEEQPQ